MIQQLIFVHDSNLMVRSQRTKLLNSIYFRLFWGGCSSVSQSLERLRKFGEVALLNSLQQNDRSLSTFVLSSASSAFKQLESNLEQLTLIIWMSVSVAIFTSLPMQGFKVELVVGKAAVSLVLSDETDTKLLFSPNWELYIFDVVVVCLQELVVSSLACNSYKNNLRMLIWKTTHSMIKKY